MGGALAFTANGETFAFTSVRHRCISHQGMPFVDFTIQNRAEVYFVEMHSFTIICTLQVPDGLTYGSLDFAEKTNHRDNCRMWDAHHGDDRPLPLQTTTV